MYKKTRAHGTLVSSTCATTKVVDTIHTFIRKKWYNAEGDNINFHSLFTLKTNG